MDSPSFDPTGLEALAAAARTGGAEAVERLVRGTYPELYRWALLRCGEPADAEDIAQEAALRMYRELPSFAGRARFTTWLYRLLANAAADFYRRDRRHVVGRAPLEALAGVAEPAEEPERRMASGRFMDLVRRFFTDLSEGQRTVFYLVDLQGHSPHEVAEMLDANPNTVRAHLLKARRAIRSRLLEGHREVVEELNGSL